MARSIFWNMVNDIGERMRLARHSSTHFLKSGWKAVKMKLKASGFKISTASLLDDKSAGNSLDVLALGDVQRGGAGSTVQWLRIENRVGMDSKYPALAAEHNRALMDYGVPALNKALAEQAQWMREKYLPRAFGEIAEAWESVPNAGPFVPGMHVRVMGEDAALSNAGAELETFG